jgi:hypothetical protein
MAELKTTGDSVADFLQAIPDERKRRDSYAILKKQFFDIDYNLKVCYNVTQAGWFWHSQ